MYPTTSTEATAVGARTRLRILSVACLAVLAMVFAASCGSDSDEGSGSDGSGETPTEESSGGLADDLKQQVEDEIEEGKDDLDQAVDDLKEDIENVPDKIADCAELTTLWASLSLKGATGDSAANIDEDSDELKKLLPDDLHDEVDTIADTGKAVSEEGITAAGEAYGSPEYSDANDAIQNHIETECL